MAGAVDTTYTFTATDVITSTKMNNIIDETVMTTDAIIGSTLAVSTGKLRVNTSGITANELATGSVTTTAILDANVTTAKIADSNITTAKIADANVTTAKIVDDAITTAKVLDANITTAKLAQPLTLGTSQSSTSGTSIDFTGIPSWVNRVTITLLGVSRSGSSRKTIQLGTSSGFVTSGYLGSMAEIAGSGVAGTALSGSGLAIRRDVAQDVMHGTATWHKTTGNTWIGNLMVGFSVGGTNAMCYASGSIALASALTQVRITTENGTDTFDAGLINIMYE
jgi:hypothetical protein